MAHSLPHTTWRTCAVAKPSRHTDTYPCTPWGLQRFVPFFICLKPDTKCCNPHGTPSTSPLEEHEFYMSFSLAGSHSYPGKNIPTKRFSQWHTRKIPALNNTAQWHWDIQGTAWQRDFSEILTRSLRDLCEIGICKARQQGSFLLFPSLLYATLITSTLQFYCYLFCVSQAIEKPSHEFLSQKEYVKNMCAKCYKNQCHKQLIHMNIMDFPSAHRLRRKKMTAA